MCGSDTMIEDASGPPRSGPPAGTVLLPMAEGYVVHEFLGRGSAGMVWRATQEGTLREVALKFPAGWALHGRGGQRFAREAEIAAALDHVNVAGVFGTGEGTAGPWLAMECHSQGGHPMVWRSSRSPVATSFGQYNPHQSPTRPPLARHGIGIPTQAVIHQILHHPRPDRIQINVSLHF